MTPPGIEIGGHLVQVRLGRPEDLEWCDDFRKKHRDMGFVPKNAMLEYLARERVSIATIDGIESAYIITNPKLNGTAHVSQLGVTDELWRNGIGAYMLQRIAAHACSHHLTGLTAKPACGLDVEHVLRSCQWLKVAKSHTAARVIRAWYLPLPDGLHLPPMMPPMSNKSRLNAPWLCYVPKVRLQGRHSSQVVRGASILQPSETHASRA